MTYGNSPGQVRAPSAQFGVDLAIGESVEVIKVVRLQPHLDRVFTEFGLISVCV